MRDQFWLSDEQWAAIKPHLPYYAAGKRCSAPGSLDTSLSHAAGLIEIAACHA